MRLKIRCDEESWKILGFWVEVNMALEHASDVKSLYDDIMNVTPTISD